MLIRTCILGLQSTSRVEGNHHTIKSYLQLEKLDLLQVYKRLHLMLSNQKAEITKGIENEKIIFFSFSSH